jgi:hypothetical protein
MPPECCSVGLGSILCEPMPVGVVRVRGVRDWFVGGCSEQAGGYKAPAALRMALLLLVGLLDGFVTG